MSMSLKVYDDAVTDYFKAVFKNTVYAPTDLALKKSAELNSSETPVYPLISVFRTPTINIGELPNTNDVGFRRGARLRADEANGKMVRARLLPVQIEYQIDLWTSGVEAVTGLFSELVFFMKDFPAFEVDLPGIDENFSHVLNITSVVDNTDLLEEADRGRIGRMSIIATVDAYIAKNTLQPLVLVTTADVHNDFPNSNNTNN